METRGITMPAIITHDFFGRDVYDQLFSIIGGSRDEADAFLLGNQGPDPLFYSAISPYLAPHTRLGNTMHAKKPAELMVALKESFGVLSPEEERIGRAYALGFLCHYTLDSTVHPFVYSQQYALCDAGVPGLSRDDGSEVHGVIESEFDEIVLYAKRGESIATFNPSQEILHASRKVLAAVSKMYSYMALNVYGEIIPARLFSIAVYDFRFVQRVFYSPTGLKRDVIGRIERMARSHSFYQAMSHRPVESAECAFDNRGHEPWTNPFTGDVRTTGFWDLYEAALERAQRNVAAFDAADFALDAAREMTGELDFSGRSTQAQILDVK